MGRLFLDRLDAGRQLAGRLRHLAGRSNLLVLGLPRGGVPVAAEVARELNAPLDVLVVRKLGMPGHEELAIGAITSGGLTVINDEMVTRSAILPETLARITAEARAEVERREQLYRGDRPLPDLRDATVILVDDGVATGSTMLVAVRALRARAPAAIVVAAPVIAADTRATLSREADGCVAVATPESFASVGAWYQDFSQTTDGEVVSLLGASRLAHPRDGDVVIHGADG